MPNHAARSPRDSEPPSGIPNPPGAPGATACTIGETVTSARFLEGPCDRHEHPIAGPPPPTLPAPCRIASYRNGVYHYLGHWTRDDADGSEYLWEPKRPVAPTSARSGEDRCA